MPVFHPQLSQTTRVRRAENSIPYHQLNFFLELGQDEDQAGQWEIWTDIPTLTKDGTLLQAGWHSEIFTPYESSTKSSSSDYEDVRKVETNRLVIRPPTDVGTQALVNTLHAALIVAVDTDTSFAYTYRRILANGEVIWYGGSQSNGAVEFTREVVSGDEIKTVVTEELRIKLDDESRAKPVHLCLATAEPCHLALFAKRHPYSALFSTPRVRPEYTAVTTFAGYTLATNRHGQLLSSEDMISPSSDILRVDGHDAGIVIDVLLQDAPHLQASYSKLKSSTKPVNLASTILTMTIGKEDKRLLLWAQPANIARDVSVQWKVDKGTNPYLMMNDADGTIVCNLENGGDSELSIHILPCPTAATAAILRLIEFDAIPVESGKSFWICSPTAERSEALAINYPRKSKPADNFELGLSDGHSAASSVGTPDTAKFSETPGTLEEAVSDEDLDVSSSTHVAWWTMLGGFMLNIWNWLVETLRPQSITADSASVDDDANSDGTMESEALITPNERTPLLKNLTTLPRSAIAGTQSTALFNDLTTILQGQPVSSALRYHFKTGPPFQFIIPSDSMNSLSDFDFSYRRSDTDSWSESSTTPSESGARGCFQLIVGPDHDNGGNGDEDWEVQIQPK